LGGPDRCVSAGRDPTEPAMADTPDHQAPRHSADHSRAARSASKRSGRTAWTRRQRRLHYAVRRATLLAAAALLVGGLLVADRLGVFGLAPPPDAEKYHGQSFTVQRVVDGDTLELAVPDAREATTTVRLWGVDTPETVHPDRPPGYFGPQATAFTRRLAAEKRVRLELEPHRTRGRYGRLLAYVFLPDGRMLNRLLIEEGYGYADPRFPHSRRREFQRLQQQAMAAGRGLWKAVRPGQLPDYYEGLKLPKRP